MDVRKIFFLVVFVSIGMILLSNQLQNQDNITIQVKGDDSLYRVSWITADNNEIIIHLAARCSINGCIN
jgi:hypothetical protein